MPTLNDDGFNIINRHQGRLPVDLEAIARDLGVRVDYVPMGLGRSGAIYRDPENGGPSGFRIEVDSSEAKVRQRFTLAHEIAHFILHRDKIGKSGVIDNAMYRSSLSDRFEAQANRLAASILMPERLVTSARFQGDTAHLASLFGVSESAMDIRLKSLSEAGRL
ncbi:MAG: ImmA/IrrE family metallo-endopeptidase [Myxococcota bacterium]